VPESQRPAFIDSLDEIGYKYAPETDNVVYNLFLR